MERTLVLVFFLIFLPIGAWAQSKSVRVDCDDLLRFSITEIEVNVGQELVLEVHNIGRIPNLKHNLVILSPETNLAAFSSAALKAQAREYIPDAHRDRVVAHTRLLSSGEHQVLSVTFQQSGSYPFICSHPGHSSVSKGKVIVR